VSPTMSTAASSPPSSSSGFRFPKKETPNAHPYAIKTTSTALLSRSNSSSSHASAHHYVPTSPSPTSAQHSPTKHHRPSRHRYSRSLTSDAPLPLPPPPNSNITSSSPSSSPVHRQYADEDDDTPRRRVQRAETLPSSVGAPVPTLDLPDDPKTWTPSQLSSYLASTLQAGDASLPTPVSKDISKFIKENRITGRVFLRLSDEDLEQSVTRCAFSMTSSLMYRSTDLESTSSGVLHFSLLLVACDRAYFEAASGASVTQPLITQMSRRTRKTRGICRLLRQILAQADLMVSL